MPRSGACSCCVHPTRLLRRGGAVPRDLIPLPSGVRVCTACDGGAALIAFTNHAREEKDNG